MALPYFYLPHITGESIQLDEPTSKHITGVLRMKRGEALLLTNGKGTKVNTVIVDDNRKRCIVKTGLTETEPPKATSITIAISLLKNAARFEWFLEKGTEIGLTEIIPLLCERTERTNFRHDRLQAILVSAMLQSQQSWLPGFVNDVAVENH